MPKMPFYIADALIVAVAGVVLWCVLPAHSAGAYALAAVCIAAVAFAAAISIRPWLKEFEAATKLAELDRMKSAVEQIEGVEAVARQIQDATARWQTVSDAASKTAEVSNGILDRIKVESTEFVKSLQGLKEEERRTMGLEIEKLRRSEGDYLQVLVRLFDHIFALNQAGQRSNQPALAQQLGQFQMACRDAARRVGLICYAPDDGEPFDERSQQTENEAGQPPAGALVETSLAAGYVFQGQLLRKSLVRIKLPPPAEPPAAAAIQPEPASVETTLCETTPAPVEKSEENEPPWETAEPSTIVESVEPSAPEEPVEAEFVPTPAQQTQSEAVEQERGPKQTLLF